MRTLVLICIPVPERLAPELDRTKAFPSVSTKENFAPLHMTLAVWIAENPSDETVAALIGKLKKIRFDKFVLGFTGSESFWSTALVLTTDVPEKLQKLRADVVNALKSTFPNGFELFDAERFRPHVTVGRIGQAEVSDDLPVIMEEIPESVWEIDSFALWTRTEEGEYTPVATFPHSAGKGKKRESALAFARLVARTVAQISLFFTCFLPLWGFLNDAWDSLIGGTARFPDLLYAAAFLSTFSATAAIGSTLKRPMNTRLAHGVTAFALACSVALFAAEIRELSVCYATESEEFFCQGIYEALIWSSCIMVWLLLLYFGIPSPKKR